MEIQNNKGQKGLNYNINPIDQDDNSLSFILNGITESHEGDELTIQSEPGNEECYSLPEGYSFVGKIYGNNNENYIFSTDGTNSELGIVCECNYQTLVNTNCLNFDVCNRITGEFRILNSCERIIYWCDGVNPDRFFNVDKPNDFRDTEGNWDCELFSINPKLDEISIEAIEIRDSGGSLELGNYFFAVEVLDQDENVIYVSSVTLPVAIYDEPKSDDWINIDGGYNQGIDPLLGPKAAANKSIRLLVSNINTNYSFLRLIAFRAITGDGQTVDAVRKGELIPIRRSVEEVLYTGYNVANGDFLIDPSEVLIPNNIYQTSNGMEQVQNRLVRLNVKNPSVDLAELQRATSKAGLRYKIKDVPAHEVAKGNPKDGLTYFDSRSFMGDEVYGFGIVYVYDSGYQSPPQIMVGRPKNYDNCNCELLQPQGSERKKETTKCLQIVVESIFPMDGQFDYSIDLKYIDDGQLVTRQLKGSANNESFKDVFEIICYEAEEFDERISNIFYIPEFANHPQKDQVTINVNIITDERWLPATGGQYVGTAPLDGWDDTVYPYYIPEMDIFGLTEDDYRLQIENVGGVYNDTSASNLALLKEKLPQFARWRIFNTSVKTGDKEGILGYYECADSQYPEILDCDGNSIWGTDCTGAPIAGQNIRHFRMPCRSLEPHYIETERTNNNEADEVGTVRLIGVEACNIEYPTDDIVGHYVVMMERTELDKTVLSKGWGHRMNSCDAEGHVGFTQLFNKRFKPRQVWMMTPESLFEASAVDAEYIKVEGKAIVNRFRQDDNCSYLADLTDDPDIFIKGRYGIMGGLDPTNNALIGIEPNGNVFMPIYSRKNDIFGEPGELLNLSASNNVQGLNIRRDFFEDDPNFTDFYYSGLKVNRNVYCNVFNRSFVKIHSSMKTLEDDQEFFGGDTIVSQLNVSNIQYNKGAEGILSFLIAAGAAILGVAGVILAPFTGGASLYLTVAGAAIFAGASVFAQYTFINRLITEGTYDCILNEDGFDCPNTSLDSSVFYGAEHVNNLWVESDINVSLRHDAGQECNEYYNQEPSFQPLREYYQNRIAFLRNPDDNNDPYAHREVICPEVYLYNYDYSLMYFGNTYVSLPASYDYCKKCENEFVHRMIWSEKSFDSDSVDNYRLYLANNFRDMPAHRGPLVAAKYRNNQLLVHAEYGTFLMRPNPQQIQTDVSNIYIGTGDFLSLPPIEMIQTDLGNGGMQSKYGSTNTEFGYVWIDEVNGEIYSFPSRVATTVNAGIGTLMDDSLNHFLEDNLRPILKNQLKKDYNIDYECEILGTMITYDPKFKRLIIHKRDYKLFKGTDISVTGKNFIIDGNDVQLGDPEYFINKSWTLSYSMEKAAYPIFHSYLPDFLINDNNHFYSAINNVSYKHLHKGNYQTYYGNKYDFVLEKIYNDYITRDFKSAYYIGYSSRWDEIHEKWIDDPTITFDRGLFYNTCQSSGIFNISLLDSFNDPYGNLDYDPNTKTMVETDRNYRLSSIWDLTVAQPATTSSWEYIPFRQEFLDGGYIDKVSFEDNLSKDDDQYDLAYLKDKWIKTRYYYKPEEDYKKVIYLSSVNQRNSIR